MDKLIAEYLKSHMENISLLYTWDFDASIPKELFDLNVVGDTNLEKTINLKMKLNSLVSKNDVKFQISIADYFIKTWGGIKRFSKAGEVVNYFSAYAGSEKIPKDFKPKFASISSWSKWASIACPHWACIYDTRVAYSINAINFINGGDFSIFPMPDGRNSRLNLFDISTLLLASKVQLDDESNPKYLKAKYFISETDAYLKYLEIVHSVSRQLWNDDNHIHEVEMLLFALADQNIFEDVYDFLSRR